MTTTTKLRGRPRLPDWTARRARLSIRLTMSRQDLDVLDRLAAVLELGRVPTIRLALDRLATSEAIQPRAEPTHED